MDQEHKLLCYALSKLTQNEINMIRGEQIGLAEMLDDYEIGFYAKEYHILK